MALYCSTDHLHLVHRRPSSNTPVTAIKSEIAIEVSFGRIALERRCKIPKQVLVAYSEFSESKHSCQVPGCVSNEHQFRTAARKQILFRRAQDQEWNVYPLYLCVNVFCRSSHRLIEPRKETAAFILFLPLCLPTFHSHHVMRRCTVLKTTRMSFARL